MNNGDKNEDGGRGAVVSSGSYYCVDINTPSKVKARYRCRHIYLYGWKGWGLDTDGGGNMFGIPSKSPNSQTILAREKEQLRERE